MNSSLFLDFSVYPNSKEHSSALTFVSSAPLKVYIKVYMDTWTLYTADVAFTNV